MKLTFIANACCIYESEGKRLVCDPWLIDGAFEGSWFHYPPLKTTPEMLSAQCDYLYISHLHPDHFCPETLKAFNKETPVIVLDHGSNYLHKLLSREGFNNLIRIKDKQSQSVGPFNLTMYAPFVNHPFHESVIGNLVDSALVVESNGIKILNTNDNTPDLKSAAELMDRHKRFDLVQLNYNAAGPFPSCFDNLNGDEKAASHCRVLSRNLKHMHELSDALGDPIVQPFAGAYVIGGSECTKNTVLGTCTQDEAADYLIDCDPDRTIVVLNESQSLDLKTRKTSGFYRIENKAEMERYLKKMSSIPYPYHSDKIGKVPSHELFSARQNLWKYQERFNYKPDLNIYLETQGYLFHFNMKYPDADLNFYGYNLREPYLKCSLDPRLLQRILDGRAHWNNAEIGCHIDFVRKPDVYLPDVHTLMSFFTAPKGKS